MSHTPKSERQYRKAEAAEERWGARSHASSAENDPAHRKHATAFDRMNGPKLAHHNRDFERHARRELARNGWPTADWSSGQVMSGHALASLDHRWEASR